ncbi:rhomboid-related protein 2-like [Daphnia pulicaria]|uniref:rhomboid-related protein 2-like n=1 Tax=Daphnia pulicaria TaxID=35523 RepID=UPI001EEA78E5|nr:rhomboid-related protein 2-like [Daphnia pulicaria]XP_046647043.1 rhomboid-related protein 2-like [Daphnia pulicaria]
MPTTGRHYSFGRQTSSRSEGDNQLYPNLTGMDIEMSNLEEDRALLQKWKPIFDQFDQDHDGAIPLGELASLLRRADSTIPASVINEIVWMADRDRNGVLDFREFMTLVRTHDLGVLYPKLNMMMRTAAYVVVPRGERTNVVKSGLEEYKCCPPPVLMPLLSLIELGVFIYYAIEMGEVGPNGPVPFKSPLIYDPYKRYEAWRFLSYMLIHAGFIHIGTNILVQVVLGIPLEMVHSWWRVLIIYVAGVIAGSLGTSVLDPTVYLAGASGGVYALLLAHLASLILNWKEMEFAIWRLLFIVILVVVDVGTAIYYRYVENVDTKVGYAAHLAGAIAGLLVGVNVLRNLQVERWEKVVWWICFTVYVALMAAAIAINFLWDVHFPPPR